MTLDSAHSQDKHLSNTEQETSELAAKFAARLAVGDVVTLSGPLGAGKSVFCRGIAGALGVDPRVVTSPTFTIVNEYPGPQPILHFDLYRINSPLELINIGWEEYLIRRAIILVEWPENAPSYMPTPRWDITIIARTEKERLITIRKLGASGE